MSGDSGLLFWATLRSVWRRQSSKLGIDKYYKVACLVHQSLAGQTRAYLADDLQLVTDTDCRRLFNQPPPGHVSFYGRTAISVTEVSALHARVCGTACHTAPSTTHKRHAFPA